MSRFQCPCCLKAFDTEAEREAHVPCPSNGTEWAPEDWDEEDLVPCVPEYAAGFDDEEDLGE